MKKKIDFIGIIAFISSLFNILQLTAWIRTVKELNDINSFDFYYLYSSTAEEAMIRRIVVLIFSIVTIILSLIKYNNPDNFKILRIISLIIGISLSILMFIITICINLNIIK